MVFVINFRNKSDHIISKYTESDLIVKTTILVIIFWNFTMFKYGCD